MDQYTHVYCNLCILDYFYVFIWHVDYEWIMWSLAYVRMHLIQDPFLF